MHGDWASTQSVYLHDNQCYRDRSCAADPRCDLCEWHQLKAASGTKYGNVARASHRSFECAMGSRESRNGPSHTSPHSGMVLTAIFPQYPTFWGPRLSAFSRPRKRPPKPSAVSELPRTLPDDETPLFHEFSRVFLEFFALTGRHWTLAEVYGKWDGRGSNPGPKP
jgi:hypothetical protein